ncbi:MAG: hypothetical protein M1814_000361 [Vezdaea aestivalis]|nr:MAG: hypothetical protein M1814_000361 [Vezdaea aestivalis]
MVGDVEAIGAHCKFAYCNQLDFLPFRCESCKDTFCLDHRTETAHKCPKEGAWAEARRKAQQGPSNTRLKPMTTLIESTCASQDCPTKINTALHPGVQCTKCNRLYCLKHRLNEDHNCANLTPLGARQSSIAIVQADKARTAFSRLKAWGREKQTTLSTVAKPKHSTVSQRLIAVNTLRKTAKGDAGIPAEKRIYLFVEAEAATTTSKLPSGEFFYNIEWSVGRVLDAAAKSLQVQNVNNRGGGEDKKLRVFHIEGGRLLEFSEKLGQAVASGNRIILLRGVGPAVPDLIEM